MKVLILTHIVLAVCLGDLVAAGRHSEEDSGNEDVSDLLGTSSRVMSVVPPPDSSTLFGNLDSTSLGIKGLGPVSPAGPPFSASFQGAASNLKGHYASPYASPYETNTRTSKQLGTAALTSALSSLSPQALLALSASGSNLGYLSDPLLTSDSTYGDHSIALSNYGMQSQGHSYGSNSGGSGGHGGGYGGGHDNYIHSSPFGLGKIQFGRPDCNSALGLLGVLGLMSFLQNVLRQMTSTTAKPLRRKRGADGFSNEVEGDNRMDADSHQIITWTLPLLTAAAHAKDGFIPVNCTHLEVCNVNQKLTRELGFRGRSLGQSITKAVHELLSHPKANHKDFGILNAGKFGRHTKARCSQRYPKCDKLDMLPRYSIPNSMVPT